MRQRPRIYYTESQKALMWERWQKGARRWRTKVTYSLMPTARRKGAIPGAII